MYSEIQERKWDGSIFRCIIFSEDKLDLPFRMSSMKNWKSWVLIYCLENEVYFIDSFARPFHHYCYCHKVVLKNSFNIIARMYETMTQMLQVSKNSKVKYNTSKIKLRRHTKLD